MGPARSAGSGQGGELPTLCHPHLRHGDTSKIGTWNLEAGDNDKHNRPNPAQALPERDGAHRSYALALADAARPIALTNPSSPGPGRGGR